MSPVLERMCLKSAVKNGKCLSLPDDDPFDFEYLIGFLYNETLSTAPLEGNDNRLLDLYILASKYELAGMKSQVYGALNLDFHFPGLCETVVKVYSAGAADEGFRMLVKNKVVSTLQATFCVGGWAPSLRILTASAHLDTTLAQDITEALMKEVEKTVVDSRNTCWGVDANDAAVRYCQTCGDYHNSPFGWGIFQDCPVGPPPPSPPGCPPPPGGWSKPQQVTNESVRHSEVEDLRRQMAALTETVSKLGPTKNANAAFGGEDATQAATRATDWGQPTATTPPTLAQVSAQFPTCIFTDTQQGETRISTKASNGDECTLSFPSGVSITNVVSFQWRCPHR